MKCRALMLVACLCAACAGPPLPAPALAPQIALERVKPGQSSKPEIAAALGPATIIAFDSGYEVWVYRWPGADSSPRAATELVLLFDRAGLLSKARIKPGYAT